MNNNLSGNSKVWIYASDRFFTNDEAEEIQKEMNHFVNDWAAHGKSLFAEGHLIENKFIVFFVDEAKAHVTGCAIDSSVAFIKSIESKYKVDMFNRQQINYLVDGEIKQDPIHSFWAKRKAKIITEETIVFDNLVKTKEEFDLSWKKKFVDSWHQEMWN